MRTLVAALLATVSITVCSPASATEPAPLVLETKIPLGSVSGRIDHLAIDLGRNRLYVAELGNDSVGAIDLKTGKVIRTITGLSEPQGVGFVASSDTLFVANGGDGSVRLYKGSDLAPSGRIDLGNDADNIRIDTHRNQVLVGYGNGALAAIDPVSARKLSDIPLKAHPEGFQLAESGSRVFVNVPEAGQIAVIDPDTRRQTSAIWPEGAQSNFPMADDEEQHRVLVAFRSPSRLSAYSSQNGKPISNVATCGDADDVFVDGKRHRVYVSCGEGVVDVFAERNSRYERIARAPTASGARTSLFVPELDRLYVAVRSSSGHPAAIWIFRPSP